MPTQNTTSSSRRPLVAMGLLVLAGMVGLGLWTLSSTPGLASLRVDSEPSGAEVKVNGVLLCTTPCTRELDPGEVALTVEKAGFVTAPRSVVLEAGLLEALPKIVLEPQQVLAEVKLPVPVTSLVTLDSTPSGAEVRLDGELVGTTPFSRPLPHQTAVVVRLELEGHLPFEDRFTVGEGAEDPHQYTLKAIAKNPVKLPVVKHPPVEVKPVGSARGTLRFVVKPWAEVECREAGIKDTTPFQDKLVPVGNYSCTFTNPEFPPQTKVVRVEANAMVKVQVNFPQ